jgi:hypothetical protein
VFSTLNELVRAVNGDRSMSTPASATLRSGRPAHLSAEVEQLLLDVVADGFILYCCGPRVAPQALVACYHGQHYVDLVTIRHFDCIITARIPASPSAGIDVFNPPPRRGVGLRRFPATSTTAAQCDLDRRVVITVAATA